MKEIVSNTPDGRASDGERVRASDGKERLLPLLRRYSWIFGLFLVAATMIAYQPVWHAGFIWDDYLYITENLTLHSTGGLAQIWDNPAATPQYYPLVFTSFWLEYHLWGLNPLGYHVVNVLLQALAAILLWRVLVRLQLPGAWLAAGIFALHPVAVESVAWAQERKNVLSAVFYLGAALACLRWTEQGADGKEQIRGSPRWYFFALALFIAALFSKTAACSLPAAMLLVIWWKRGRIAGGDVWPLLPFFAAGVALGLVTSWVERTLVGAQGPEWGFSFPERCLIAGRALWFYAAKLFWPANLTFIYPRWQLNAGAWWQWIYPVAALAVVVVLWCLRKHIGRGPLVAVLFFGGTLLPALGFGNFYFMRYSFVADHFQYLASIGPLALAAAGIATAFGFLRARNPWFRPVFCGVVLLTLGVLTWRQCWMYADDETLWRTTIDRNPACWMAHNNFGEAISKKGQTGEAISQYQEAIRLKPDYALAHNNLGLALAKKNQIDEAMNEFQEAIRFKPDYPEAHINLGVALLNQGQTDEATSQFRETIRLKPDDADAQSKLAKALDLEKKSNEQRSDPVALNNLAWMLATSPDASIRDGTQAVQLAQRACRLTDFKQTIFVGTLAAAYAEAGRFDDAMATAQKAIALAQQNGERDLLQKNQELLERYRQHQTARE